MAQLFHPATNTISRLSLVIFGFLGPAGTLVVATGVSRSPFNTKVGVPISQPVAFSHEHHTVELGIDCRYCHSQVEKSPVAGVPPTETCMSCHSQIWTNSPLLEPVRESYRTGKPLAWNQVNSVPEFVYFPHNIHIARGLSCNNCHGPVQKMMLTYKGQAFFMVWCLNCHRQPEKYIQPREAVWDLYLDNQRGTLTPREQALINGAGTKYHPSSEELAQGETYLQKYHIRKESLTDCAICHR